MDAATIEQMNKVRASVGLAPLPVPGQTTGPKFKDAAAESSSDEEEDLSTLDKRQAAADGNWQKLENERLDRLERQKRKDAAKKARDAAARYAKLEGKGLGDAEDAGDLDTRTWLLQQKKRQKKIDQARKLEAELAEREREMQAAYTSNDLAGVKVGHEIEEFDELTGEKILTLKDTVIGEDSDDDELENQDLKEQEKVEERLRLKKKRPDYDPTEEGERQGFLTKYDEEIDGRKQKKFKLDGQGTSTKARQEREAIANDSKPGKGIKISLDLLQDDTPATDYLDASSIKVKKPKKKKEKKTRQKALDEDDVPQVSTDAMDVDQQETKNNKRPLDLDDDDLQSRLAAQRREALKKRKKMDPAELARQMREDMEAGEASRQMRLDMAVDGEEEEGGLLIDETSEFVANLKRPDTPDQDSDEEPAAKNIAREDEDAHPDAEMKDVDDELNAEHVQPTNHTNATGLDVEEDFGGHGLGASVALLRKRGILQDKDAAATAEKERQRRRFLAEKQSLIEEFDLRAKEQREAERRSGRLDKMTNRERDAYAKQQNEDRERYLSKLQADMFNAEYKPEVKLQYYDEFGRSMNQKEAFKHLSHSFHGKASGKQKTEKRLKKIADERKDMAKGVLHVGEGGLSSVQGREGKRTKQAGVRLQ